MQSRQRRTWLKRMMWPLSGLSLFVALFVSPAVSALASSGPKAATHPKPFVTREAASHPRAVTCSGNTCTGLDPYQTGCAQSFYPSLSNENYPILVELEYSPICHTNWTQAYRLDGSTSANWGASIERFAGPDGPDWDQSYWTPTHQWWINTNQVYSPSNKADACGLEVLAHSKTIVGICADQLSR